MEHHYQYAIKPDDQFEPARFPLIGGEVNIIQEKTKLVPALFKGKIIMAFLRDHSLLKEWMKANPELTRMVISRSLFTGAIESLFEASRENRKFQQQLDLFLGNQFAAQVIPAARETFE